MIFSVMTGPSSARSRYATRFSQPSTGCQNKVIDVEPLVSHRLPLADFADGFAQFMAGKTLKVHLTLGD